MNERPALHDLSETTRDEIFLIVSLTFINVINYVDRVGIAAVLVDIQQEFAIGDDYGGLLQTVLLVFYTISAPFFGFVGDRYNRKWLLVACIILWAIFTIIGAVCGKYWGLLLSRAMVGIGESGFTTIAPTVISDFSVRGARSVFLALFCIGIPIGAGIGYSIVTFITKMTGSWKLALCAGPVLTVIGVTMLMFCKLPERGKKEIDEIGGTIVTNKKNVKEDIFYLMQVPSFLTLTAAFLNMTFLTGAVSWWMPTCLFYGFQLIPTDHSMGTLILGLLTIITGIIAILMGLLLSRSLRPRYPSSDPIICGVSELMAFPMLAIALYLSSKSVIWTFVFIFLGDININLNWAILVDMLLYVVVPIHRSSAQGLNMFVGHGLGDCISPYIVGLLSEFFQNNFIFGDRPIVPQSIGQPFLKSTNQHFRSIQLSLYIVALTILFASFFFFLTGKFVTKDRERAQNEMLRKN